jgi:hypothetical protein
VDDLGSLCPRCVGFGARQKHTQPASRRRSKMPSPCSDLWWNNKICHYENTALQWRGGFVMVIYFLYSAWDSKYCSLNMILYSILKMKDLLAVFFLLLLSIISILHTKLNVGYLGEYEKWWWRPKSRTYFSYLLLNATIKMQSKLWTKGIDACILK